MISTIYRYKIFGFLAFWLFGLIACGGGGSSSSQKPSDGGNSDNGNPAPDVSNNTLNPVFEGKLFYYDSDHGPVNFFDFKTGTAEAIPQTNWLRDKERFPSGVTSFTARPTIDGEQWVLSSEECDTFVGAGGCLYIQDKFGNYTGPQLHFNFEAKEALLSRDQNYVLVLGEPIASLSLKNRIFDFNGKIYDVLDAGSTSSDKVYVDWLVDNRLVFVDTESDPRSFQFTSPLSFDVEYKFMLPEQLTGSGVIGEFSVSPSGQHIAFRLSGENEDKKRSIWVMDIDTGALNRFLQIGESYNTIDMPRWSPSGKYLAVLSGSRANNFIDGVDSTPSGPDDPIFYAGSEFNSLFVVPTDNMMSQTYIVSKGDDRSSEVVELQQRLADSNEVSRDFKSDFYDFRWVE